MGSTMETTTLDAPVRVDLKIATRVGYDEGHAPQARFRSYSTIWGWKGKKWWIALTHALSQPDLRSHILSAAEISQDQIADPGNKVELFMSPTTTTAFVTGTKWRFLQKRPRASG
jgi:hypothetical protein